MLVERMFLLITWYIVCWTSMAECQLCSTEVPNGIVASECPRQIRSVCQFTCDSLYKPAAGVKNVTCGRGGKWTFKSSVCVEKDLGFIMTVRDKTFTKDIFIQPITSRPKPSRGSFRPYRCPEDALLTSVAGDYILQHAYMYDYYSHTIYRDANFSIDFPGNDVMTIFHRGISSDFVNLAVDWISHNIYWTDPSYKWIMVKSLTSNDMSMYRVLIHEDLEGPRALALDPMEGLLFWSDIGTWPRIEVSSLSGRNRKTLILSKVIYPYSLAADYAPRRLYLYDLGRKSLESITYEGKDRKNFLTDQLASIFGIAVYKDSLYMTDKKHFHYLIVNKKSGDLLYESQHRAFLGITLFRPDAKFNSSMAHCINHGCGHICVTEEDGATCLCKDGYTLNQDKRTCSLRTEYFHRGLMFSNASSVCVVDIRVVADFAFDPKCVIHFKGTIHMVMDTDKRQIILASEMSIYRASVDNPWLRLVAKANGIISGLAWDGYDRSVYWTEKDTGTIWRHSIKAGKPQVFNEGLKNPRDIIILSHQSLVYWISDRNGSIIESSKRDGSNHNIVLDSDSVVDPKSLSYDQYTKRIYFLDTLGKDQIHIRSFNLDGSALRTFRLSKRTFDMLEIYKGHLLVTANDVNRTLIVSYSISTGEETTSGVFPSTGIISSIKIFDENVRQNKIGPCFNNNGECEDICIPNGNTRICDCRFGFRLTENGKNCTSDTMWSNFMLVVDSTDNTVYLIGIFNKRLEGISIRSSESLNGVTYSPIDQVFIFGATSELVITHPNGTIKTVFPVSKYDDVVHTPNRFAVDYSTGNIFYTAANNQKSIFHKTDESYIGVLSPSGQHRTLVLGLNDPSGLAVYPSKGLLFYSEGAFSPCIGKANMDGSESSIVLNLPQENPTDLTIDYTSDNLYYIDSLRHSVKYCKMDGTNHKTLIEYTGDSSILAAFAMNGHLYISTARNSSILRVDISTPSVSTTYAHHGELGRINFISINSASTRNTNNLCNNRNGGCSTFCFPVPSGRLCGCEDGIEFNTGSKQVCSNMRDQVLLVTSNRTSCTENLQIIPLTSGGFPVIYDRYVRPYQCKGEALFTSITGDYILQHAYMYDYNTHTIYRDVSFFIDLSENDEVTMFHRGLSRDYVNLAVDWISHNIYWTDFTYRWIMVKSLLSNGTSMHRVLIHENLEGPRALALDPMEGLLFWSDIGTWTKIEVSSLSGRNRKTLIYSKVMKPTSLAADYAARRFYLFDSGRRTLETLTYEGKDRKVLFRNEHADIFGIAVYKDYLYMTDKSNKRFRTLHKTTGSQFDTVLNTAPMLGISLFRPDTNSNLPTANCISHSCEHICVAEKDVATCLCKDGYTLNQDSKTCSLRTEYFHRGLMFSNDSSICIADIRVVTDFTFDAKCVIAFTGTTHMVLDTDQRRMILASEMSIYWGSVDNPKLDLLTEACGIISGLAWDGYDRSVYWTEKDTGAIWKHTTETDFSHVLFRGLNKPRDIIVLSHESLVYWISETNGNTIESSNRDGSNYHIVLDSVNVVEPRSLSYDQHTKRIYFVDTFGKGQTQVRSFELDGSNIRTFLFGKNSLDMLEIYKGHLLVTANDVNATLIMSYSISTVDETTSGVFPSAGKLSAIKIFDENIRQNETGPCYTYNGECEDICIPYGKMRVCDCRFGFRLTVNGKNCTSDPIKDNFMLVVDIRDNTVYQLSLMDQSLQGIGIKTTDSLNGVTYNPVDNVIIFGAPSKLVVTHLNGTIKAVIPVAPTSNIVYTPKRFAVDYSTGNIYYTVTSKRSINKTQDGYIGVLSTSGKIQTLLVKLIDPTGLAVYPSKGFLFYSEGRTNPHIGRVTMAGSSVTVVLKLNGEDPSDLTIDYKNDNLYYIDRSKNSVSKCKLDGTNHKNFAYYSFRGIVAASIYQNYVFVSFTSDMNIHKLSISGRTRTTTFSHHGELGPISFISIYSSTDKNTNPLCKYDNGGCSTFCFPIPGGAKCGCEDGIKLMDGSDKICSNNNDLVLLMTSRSTSCKENIHIQHISIGGIPIQRYIHPYRCTGEALFTSIAGDYTLQQTFMYDLISHTIFRDAKFSINLPGNDEMSVFHTGISRDYVNLAVDWINHNIYWTDASYKWIMVKSLLSNDMSMYRVLIHENLDRPRALALDPLEGLLFWSDIGRFKQIEVSSLSGRNRKTLISSKLLNPITLAADVAARRLYFFDVHRHTLETITYEGKDRKRVSIWNYGTIVAIAVYKEYLYMTLRTSNSFRALHKTLGYSFDTDLATEHFLGLSVFRPDDTSNSPTAHCINQSCEHICVAEKDVTTCLCKDGYTLNQDTKTCSLRAQYFHRGLMFSNDSNICIADIGVVTDFTFDPKCVMSINGTTHIALDTDQRRMILAREMSIYWALVDNPKLHLLTEACGIISGLAWDGYERSVYWTEEDTGAIWRHKTETDSSHVLFRGLKKPRDIIVLSHERLVYWISDRNRSTIESSNSDGSNHRIVLDSEKVMNPRSLSYDQYRKRIFFLDTIAKDETQVLSMELDGSFPLKFHSSNTTFDMLEIYKGHLLLTANDANGTLITSISMRNSAETTSGFFSSAGKISAIKIFDEHIRLSETGPCFNYNGECEDICIPHGKTRLCDCRFGFRLADNGKNCSSDPIKDNFMLVVDSIDNTMYQISLIDQSLQGIDVILTDYLTGVTYSPFDNVIIFGARSKLVICYLNGTIKAEYPVPHSDDDVHTPTRFAVDYSTGNIYYTVTNIQRETSQNYIGVLSPSGQMRKLVNGLNSPSGLAVYPSKGLLFYSEGWTNPRLGRATMDGGMSSILVNLTNEFPTDLTIDYKHDNLYYFDRFTQRVKYCKLDGTEHKTFLTYSGTKISAAFLYQDHMFISTTTNPHISKIRISDQKETTKFSQHDELGEISVINIYSSRDENKNKFCSVGNGGCSTFCFPIPNGGICGCEDGVQLSEGSANVCSNIQQP